MSDGMRRELVYLSSYAPTRYYIPNWGNIYKEHELERETTCAKFAHTGKDADQTYQTALYNTDGTKRIADNTLVALTLMIAESRTEEKDVMVKVVVNLINKNNYEED